MAVVRKAWSVVQWVLSPHVQVSCIYLFILIVKEMLEETAKACQWSWMRCMLLAWWKPWGKAIGRCCWVDHVNGPSSPSHCNGSRLVQVNPCWASVCTAPVGHPLSCSVLYSSHEVAWIAVVSGQLCVLHLGVGTNSLNYLLDYR